MPASTEEFTFSRMSFKQRGHFANTLRLFPIKKITLSESGITLTKRNKVYKYEWTDILSATLEPKEFYKAYGSGIGPKMVKKTLVLKTRDNIFKFDVSYEFPDFANNSKLLKALRKYLDISERKVKRFNYTPNIIFILILIFLSWWLKNEGY